MIHLKAGFFARDTLIVARELIGAVMTVGPCAGRIVETEAYKTDQASHAVTRRKQAACMFNTYGYVYVYFTYGMYHCLNFTTEAEGVGAVLIRAVEPLAGIDEMKNRRRTDDVKKLASGPGKLCRAFGIDLSFNGKPIGEDIRVTQRKKTPIICSNTRIGIRNDTDLEWRFYEKDSPFISKTPKP